MKDPVEKSVFPDAGDDALAAEIAPPSAQTQSPSYRLAYTDDDFLLSDEARSVRLQLELLKPELSLAEQQIHSTVVVFGSARIPAPEEAKRAYTLSVAELESDPRSVETERRARVAKNMLISSQYYEEARQLAKLIAGVAQESERERYDFVIMTGGGPGIMEAANRGANEAGAPSIGLNITLPHEQAPNEYITPELCFQFHYFALRKMHFLMRARALVTFPGGFGTLDELFETLTLVQTKKIKPIPILLYGETYWREIINFDGMVEQGVISQSDLSLFTYVETAEQGWEIIEDFYQ
ncbi:MAG: TIGR00730 family Rossman fold protein [bacterium]